MLASRGEFHHPNKGRGNFEKKNRYHKRKGHVRGVYVLEGRLAAMKEGDRSRVDGGVGTETTKSPEEMAAIEEKGDRF